MKECMDVPAVQARLKRVEGQVRGIHEMVGKDVPCDQILIQIGAAKAALQKIGQLILEGHLQHCIVEGIEKGEAERTMKELAATIEQFSRMN
ncbi:MAG: metal-sensing transcriptional repressor [Methanomassiliicoccus sp.]|nr:metal-sensing transcriptional repressor [Methanomassiliicoccus sp.]